MNYQKQARTNEYIFGDSTDVLATSGIGSCVVVIFWNSRSRDGALAHISTPSNEKLVDPLGVEPGQTIPFLLKKLKSKDLSTRFLEATLIGGGNMFESTIMTDYFSIGPQIVLEVREILKELNIKIKNEDIGGAFGRKVKIDLSNGLIEVHSTDGKTKVFKNEY